MARPKYDSSRDRGNYTFHPGRLFSLNWIAEPGECYLVPLSERQLTVLRRMVAVMPKYHWVWQLSSPRKNWDVATQNIWDNITDFVEKLEVDLMPDCTVNELSRAIRELNANLSGQAVDLTQPIPDNIDYTLTGAHAMLHEHLQSLGPIPKSGDTIMTSLQKIASGLPQTVTLDDAIIEMSVQLSNDPEWSYKDYLETLTFLKELMPSLGGASLAWVMQLYQNFLRNRYWHNDLSLKALQAQNMRSVANALSAFEPDGVEDEQTVYSGIFDDLLKMPWLTQMAVAIFDPSPVGELTLATRIGSTAINVWNKAKLLWDRWVTDYLGEAKPKELPTSTVTGEIAKLREALGDFDTGGSPNLKPSLAAIQTAISGLDLTCNCGAGGGPGCGCGSGNGGVIIPPSQPGTEGGEAPPGMAPLDDAPGTALYQNRKCKASEMFFVEVIAVLQHVEDTSLISLIAAVGVGAVVLILTGFTATLAGPLLVAALGVGFVAKLVIAFAAYSASPATFITLLEANKNDLICSLYTSTDADGAIANFKQVLIDAGASNVQLSLINVFLATEAVNLLYFTLDDPGGQGQLIEQQIDDFSGIFDCSTCETCQDVIVDVGNITSQGAGTITVQSDLNEGKHKATLYFNSFETSPTTIAYCTDQTGVQITNITTTNNLVAAQIDDHVDNTSIADVHFYPPNGSLPTFPYEDVGRIFFIWNDGEQGSITVSFNGGA